MREFARNSRLIPLIRNETWFLFPNPATSEPIDILLSETWDDGIALPPITPSSQSEWPFYSRRTKRGYETVTLHVLVIEERLSRLSCASQILLYGFLISTIHNIQFYYNKMCCDFCHFFSSAFWLTTFCTFTTLLIDVVLYILVVR